MSFFPISISATAPGGSGGLLVNQNGYLELVDPQTQDRSIVFSPEGDSIGAYAISPNGEMVVYEYFYYDSFSNSYIDAGMMLSTIDGNQTYFLGDQRGSQFSFSPDGSMIAYSYYDSDSSKNSLRILDLSDLTVSQLEVGVNNHPAWSPDGHYIAYPKNNNIYIYDITQSISSPVTSDGLGGIPTDWSPDGESLLILRGQKLYILDSNTKVLTDIDPTNSYDYVNGGAFSPDGNSLAFTTYNGGQPGHLYVRNNYLGSPTTHEIPTTDLRGGVAWQTIPLQSMVYRFWSPDYRHHFFTTHYNEALSVMMQYPDRTWTYEGVAFQESVNATCDVGEVPVYRFWSDTLMGHFFTADSAERDYIITHYPSNVWRYEGQSFCSISPSAPDTKPVYRFWSDQYHSHFYTTDLAERDYIMAHYPVSTWHYEGIAYYAL